MKRAQWYWILVLAVALFGACYTPGEKLSGKVASGASWHTLKMGERLAVNDSAWVMRVPGGWVFRSKAGYGEAACLIPYSDEGR